MSGNLPVRKCILYSYRVLYISFIMLQTMYFNIMSNVLCFQGNVLEKNHKVALWDCETGSWLPLCEYGALALVTAH